MLATLVTDKPDYAPGETALLTASGYQIGETVKFQVLHIDGTPNTGNGHDPWNVVDGGAGDLDGLANGNVKTTWYVDPDDSLGSTFEASALGLLSSLLATTTFTDAGPPPSPGQLNQWDPGNDPDEDWVTGNNDGPYFEGDTVPYYITLDNLVVGNVYRVTIGYDTTKSGKHAFDYLRTYNQTIAFPPAVDPAVDAGVAVDPTPDTIPIPLDPNVSLANGFMGVQQPGVFTMYNGDMTATSGYTLLGSYAGDSTTTIDVIFTAQDDGVGGVETNVLLTWGGHIATRQDWGPDSSAVSIQGSPYHMRLISAFDITDPNEPDDLGGGNQDRSLSAEAVIFPGTITIIKDAQPNDAQNFEFNPSDSLQLANFFLDDDADGTLSNQQVFSGVLPGSHSVQEINVPAGWVLTNIVVAGAVNSTFQIGNDGDFDPGDSLVTIDLAEAENVTVTYTNVRQFGSIAWEKRREDTSALQGGATFEISPDPTDGVGVLAVLDNGPNDADPDDGQFLVNNVPVGSFTVTETISPTGFALDDDVTRAVTVTGAALNQVIGTQGQDDPGNTDESDFHNRLGSVAWEKRTDVTPFPLQGGATFELNFDDASGFATITVVDNGLNDADPVAGQ
ncbi:MAG: hypothetical protein L0211_15395, partial [Planctomycetaceae bacterium]|nr:hypothetical protein [Planctomycetaceae bacterium]